MWFYVCPKYFPLILIICKLKGTKKTNDMRKITHIQQKFLSFIYNFKFKVRRSNENKRYQIFIGNIDFVEKHFTWLSIYFYKVDCHFMWFKNVGLRVLASSLWRFWLYWHLTILGFRNEIGVLINSPIVYLPIKIFTFNQAS